MTVEIGHALFEYLQGDILLFTLRTCAEDPSATSLPQHLQEKIAARFSPDPDFGAAPGTADLGKKRGPVHHQHHPAFGAGLRILWWL
jgi:hypothetical protein